MSVNYNGCHLDHVFIVLYKQLSYYLDKSLFKSVISRDENELSILRCDHLEHRLNDLRLERFFHLI